MNEIRVARNAMRSRFEIILCGARAPAELTAASEEALDEIARVETQLSAYDPESDLYHANAFAHEQPVRVQGGTWNLLRRAEAISRMTGGAFDMTVAPLVMLWRERAAAGDIPTPQEIEEARKNVGMEHIQLYEDYAVGFDAPDVRLDPGAIGKGYALDRAADLLRDCGVTSALLHGGTSTVYGLGAPQGDTRGWRVAVQHPQKPDARIATVFLKNMALSVSAVHGRTFYAETAGVSFGHIIDPRTGAPVTKTLCAAVAAPFATDTDALSTALLVLGRDALPDLRARLPDAAWLTATQNGDGITVDKTDSPVAQWHDSTEG